MAELSERVCEDCGKPFPIEPGKSIELSDRVARVFKRYLEDHYPEKIWVRVHLCRDCSAARPRYTRG